MTLTLGSGPFGAHPAGTFNFAVDAPQHHVLYLEACPRRVRTVLGGEIVADSRAMRLLHETGHLPTYYFREEDVRADLLQPSEHRTHCPFKGEAHYRSVEVGDRLALDAVWSYPEPLEGALSLAGLVAFEWAAMDRWFEEDDEVFVHPRDPYHRIDVLPARRPVRVTLDDQVLAESEQPRILFENGLPPRPYLDPGSVRLEHLIPSPTRTRCPYKGLATYYSAKLGADRVADVAWSYPSPLHDARSVAGWICFDPEKVQVRW